MVSARGSRHTQIRHSTDGMTVYAAGGDKLGTVRDYDPESSTLDVNTNALISSDFPLGWDTVEMVNADGITLRLNKKVWGSGRFATCIRTHGSSKRHYTE